MSESAILNDCDTVVRLLEEAESLRGQLSNLIENSSNSQVSTRANSATHSPSVPDVVPGPYAGCNTSFNMEAPSPGASTVYLSGCDTGRRAKSRIRQDLESYRPSPELARLLPTISRAVHRKALVAIDKYGIEMVKWKNGFSALHWAAKSDRPDICTYLIARGADPSARDDQGQCPRDYTSSSAVIEVLAGPPNTLQSMVDISTLPPTQLECLETISKHGWSRLKWGGGWTIMHWAFQENRKDVIAYLKSLGVSEDQLKDDKGRLPEYYGKQKTNFSRRLLPN